MIRSHNKGVTGTVFLLMLFLLFAVLSLALVLYGARVYQGVVGDMDGSYAMRASLNYVSNKLHAADGGCAVNVEEAAGVRVLTIADETGSVTCIYYYNGTLMEQYVAAGAAFEPAVGQAIVELEDFDCAIENGGVKLTAQTGEEAPRSITVYFRTMGGDA